MDPLEDDGISREEEVEQPVDEGHVDTQEQHDGFADEEPQRPTEILGDEFAEIHFDLLLLGVDAPIQSPPAEHGGFLLEHDRRVGFFEEEKVEGEGEEAHDGDQIFRPSPAERRIHDDEASDKRG